MSVPYVCCTKRFEDHYAGQIGSGLTHYKGINFQKGYGIGGIFRRLFKAALPFLVKGVLSQEKTTSPYFQSVYSRDTLPPLQENMCAIVNSDDSSQPGTQWLALFVNDKRELEFYDSFGQPPVFYNISTTTYLDVLWNSKVFQSPTSNVFNARYSSYVSTEIRELIVERNRARKIWQFTRNPSDKRVLNNIHNRLRRKIKSFQNKIWEDDLRSLDPDDGSLWEMSKELRKKKTPVYALNGPAGIANTDSDKAEVLACSLESQFQNNDISHSSDFITNRIVENYFLNENNFDAPPLPPPMPSEIIEYIKKSKARKNDSALLTPNNMEAIELKEPLNESKPCSEEAVQVFVKKSEKQKSAESGGKIIWRGANAMMTLFFVLASGVQFNDPDPFLWVPLYGTAAILTATITIRPNLSGKI
ncbi:uncharacterized protein TNIN_441161 [Trichonephila inaurata madagascariensis]|uniref:Uncharacterized protein n=1 Tax=Trichonephila inaurata madagascariensis TaxID=2747483 RepID=A0A8X7CHG3_9ARAC|nr:uncharacterized protein TNIN_441161 [Trichonephila inaurata madagascariensis]